MPKNNIRITKWAPPTCDICGSTDVQYWISFTDRDKPAYPINVGNGKTIIPPNHSVKSCKDCVQQATNKLLEVADLLPPDSDTHVANILEAIEFDIEEAKEEVTKENVIRRFREAGYPTRLLVRIVAKYHQEHPKPDPEAGHP